MTLYLAVSLSETHRYKTPTNTTEPAEEPDWRHDPQFITLPGMEDNVLEVIGACFCVLVNDLALMSIGWASLNHTVHTPLSLHKPRCWSSTRCRGRTSPSARSGSRSRA